MDAIVETSSSDHEKQSTMLASFLEITVAESVEIAKQFLEATTWKLEQAIQLFFIRANGSPSCPRTSSYSYSQRNPSLWANDEDEVRAPLPVRREVLYDYYEDQHEEEEFMGIEEIWNDNRLASMFSPPINLLFRGVFQEAKQMASKKEKWLLVNLQSKKEFDSHRLNRDTWSNEALGEIISNNFIFWQVYDETTEGRKVSTYYNLHDSIPPVVLLLDPITGQKMRSWVGMIEPETLLEELVPFMDAGLKGKFPPHQKHQPIITETENEEEMDEDMLLAIKASMETIKDHNDVVYPSTTSTDIEKEEKPIEINEETSLDTCLMKKKKKIIITYPALPEEPKEVDRKLVCRVGFRLPQDGRRVQRSFLHTDSIQLLWSFISSQVDEEEVNRPFKLTASQGFPGSASKTLDYESKLSFEESGLSNSMISVTWDD